MAAILCSIKSRSHIRSLTEVKTTVAHRDKTLAQIENTCTNHKTLAQIIKHLQKLQNTCTNYKTLAQIENTCTNRKHLRK